MAFYRKSGGGNVAPSVVRRRSGGGWANVQTIKRRSGGSWVTVWTAYTAPTLSGPSTVYWGGINNRPPSTFTTYTGTAVSGGNAATSVSWTYVSGSKSIACDTPNAVNARFSAIGGLYPGTEVNYTAVWQLTYSDGITQLTKTVTLNFTGS